MLTIREDDLSGVEARALVALHLVDMQEHTPTGLVHALDPAALRLPGVTFWTAWSGATIAGMAALRVLTPSHGEVKSMRTHPDFLRQGVSTALLDHVIAEARRRGVRQLSLETGSGPAFEPALALYRQRGFVDCPAFGDYEASGFNRFLTRSIADEVR